MTIQGVAERSLARRFLLSSDRTRELLFRLSSRGGVVEGDLEPLELLLRIADQIGIDEGSRDILSTTLRLVRAGSDPSTADLARIDSILQDCVRGIEEFLEVNQNVSAQVSPDWSAMAVSYGRDLRALRGGVEQGVDASAHQRNLAEVRDAIFRQPGKFITKLYEELNPTGSRKGFSYGSVRGYVDELVRREQVITLGGPQWSPRYCFPDPNRLESRKRYYDGPFAVRAVLECDLYDDFDYSHVRGPVPDVFLANGILKDPVLLLARNGNLHRFEKLEIKSYGQILPFRDLEKRFGLTPQDPARATPHDLLVAFRVTLAGEPEREATSWSDRDHQTPDSTDPERLG